MDGKDDLKHTFGGDADIYNFSQFTSIVQGSIWINGGIG